MEFYLDTEEKDWHSYLKMLSVERTEPFISELGLPIQQNRFQQVMRFARACLEVEMFPRRETKIQPDETHEFLPYWNLYRGREGVLGEELLRQYAERYEDDRRVLFVMATELRDWIGADTAISLNDWFRKNYRATQSGYQAWLYDFRSVLRANSYKRKYPLPTPIQDEQWLLVQAFCDDFDLAKKRLAERFHELDREAKQNGPSLWEAALQTFPIDSGVGESYPWLGRIKACLDLGLFRDYWRRLNSQLGSEAFHQFLDWTRKSASQSDAPDEHEWFF